MSSVYVVFNSDDEPVSVHTSEDAAWRWIDDNFYPARSSDEPPYKVWKAGHLDRCYRSPESEG